MAKNTDISSKHIEQARGTMESGLNSTVQTIHRATDQFTQVLGLAGPRAEELAQRSSQNIEALSQASNILVKGAQEFLREWFELVQEHMSKNIDAINRLASCHSLQDFVSVQSHIARDRLAHTVESSRRLATVSLRVADEAARVIQSQAGRNAGEMEKNLRRVL
jgi:phasin family protein